MVQASDLDISWASLLWTRRTGRRSRGRPRIRWRIFLSHLAWKCLRITQKELESVARKKDVWNNLSLLRPDPE